jgi:predicted Zn-dependent protease
VTAYLLADSAAAAERAAREWLRRLPRSSGALGWMANALVAQGRGDEALAVRRSAAHQPAGTTLRLWEAIHAIRAGDFARGDRLLRAQAESGSRAARASAFWYLTISLRYQGRMSEALRTAREYRARVGERGPGLPRLARRPPRPTLNTRSQIKRDLQRRPPWEVLAAGALKNEPRRSSARSPDPC